MAKENYKFQGTGLDRYEKVWAKKRFSEYQKRYPHEFDSISKLALLEELVFAEALQERHKKHIGKLTKNSASNEDFIIPDALRNLVDEDLERVLKIKDKLNLKDKVEKEQTFLKLFNTLAEKFKIWESDNISERECVCPYCAEVFYLHLKTDKYIAGKTPFFEGRVLTNKPLFEVYKAGKITKEDVAKILGTSVDYVEKLEEMFDANKTDK